MSATEAQPQGAGDPSGGGAGTGGPSEAEAMAAYEAELGRITSAEMILQTVAALLNIGGRRLGLGAPAEGEAPERDLEQVRDAIDAVRALMPIVERRAPGDLRPLRDALSTLQMAYAREVSPQQQEKHAEQQEKPAERQQTPDEQQAQTPKGPGPAEASGRLWVPGR